MKIFVSIINWIAIIGWTITLVFQVVTGAPQDDKMYSLVWLIFIRLIDLKINTLPKR